MIKKLSTLLSVIIILISCDPSNIIFVKENDVLVESYEIDKDSLRHGFTKKFYASGNLFEKSTYTHGKLDGERLIFYPNGTIEIRENYCGGMFCDTLTTYFPNGNRKFEGVYNHGIMNGNVRGFYDSGELKEEVNFMNNVEEGPFKEYHKNGIVKWEGTFRNGPNEYGTLIEYDSLGQKLKIMVCDSLAICRTTWRAE